MSASRPEPHAETLLGELRGRREVLLSAHPNARLLAFWDLDGTLLQGDCSEGFAGHGRDAYPGLVRLAIERGYSGDYSPDAAGYAACREDYAELRDRIGGWIAYPYLIQIFAGAEERALAELSANYFDRTLRAFYFVASRVLFDGLAADGVEQHILSASAEVFVRGAAGSLGVAAERLHGIRVRVVDGRLTRELLHPVTYAEGKTAKLRAIVAAAEAETPERPVFTLAAFGNSFDTDGDFLAHVVRQSWPQGQPLAVMINAEFAPDAYRRMFRSVRQTRAVGES